VVELPVEAPDDRIDAGLRPVLLRLARLTVMRLRMTGLPRLERERLSIGAELDAAATAAAAAAAAATAAFAGGEPGLTRLRMTGLALTRLRMTGLALLRRRGLRQRAAGRGLGGR